MPKRDWRKANLGAYAKKRARVNSPESENEDTATHISGTVDSRSAESVVLTTYSEDGDLPTPENEKKAQNWLAQHTAALAEKLKTMSISTEKKIRGPYRTKIGNEPALRTKQHHEKVKRDQTTTLRRDGFPDIRSLFARQAQAVREEIVEVSPPQAGNEVGNQPMHVQQLLERGQEGDAISLDYEWEEGDDEIQALELDFDGLMIDEGSAREEDGLGDIPEGVEVQAAMHNGPLWEPQDTAGRFYPPPSPEQVKHCIVILDSTLRPKRNTGYGHKDPRINLTLRMRLETMLTFLRLYRRNGFCDWMGSSVLAAEAAGKGAWLARKLREWTHCLVRDPEDLPIHSYGRFNSSILDDEDIAEELQLHLQSLGPWFSSADIVRFMNTPEMQARLCLKKPISQRTAQRWLVKMSWRWKKEPKGQYKDGHERDDVVDYRQHSFLPTMAILLPRFTRFNIDGSPIPSTLEGKDRVVLWSHDESTFYANDRRKIRWVHADESAKPYAKGEGLSLMVSDFVSPDFGWLRAPGNGSNSARKYFKAGKQRDGYFDNKDILQQVSRAMDILDQHYPNYTHWFGYDNATIHRKRRPNAISATHMTVNPTPLSKPNFLFDVTDPDGNTCKVEMDPGRFHDGTPQPFYFPSSHPTHPGRFKGMRQIVRERFEYGCPGVPNPDAHPRTGKKVNGECKGFKCEKGATDCCLRRILYTQPDFIAQKSALEELCEARGYRVVFYPKFHCELNPIEMSWGFSKRVYREFPASSAEADLERNVEAALQAVPLTAQRKFFTRTLRFMDAYRRGLNGQQAAWAAKKYRGHRVLPDSIIEELDKANLRPNTSVPPPGFVPDADSV